MLLVIMHLIYTNPVVIYRERKLGAKQLNQGQLGIKHGSSHCSCGRQGLKKEADRNDEKGQSGLAQVAHETALSHSPWALSQQDICSNVPGNSSHKCPERVTTVNIGMPVRASGRVFRGVGFHPCEGGSFGLSHCLSGSFPGCRSDANVG